MQISVKFLYYVIRREVNRYYFECIHFPDTTLAIFLTGKFRRKMIGKEDISILLFLVMGIGMNGTEIQSSYSNMEEETDKL